MRFLRKLYYKLFPTYIEKDVTKFDWMEADKLIKISRLKGENKWVLSKLEDNNTEIGYVYLCKRVRIWQ